MEMYKLLALADDTDKSFDGLFSGAGHIVGIVLAVTGLLLLYIALSLHYNQKGLHSFASLYCLISYRTHVADSLW